MKQLAWLGDVSYKDIALVGGKAASLGEMTKAGLPVPAGFVVTTDGFRAGMSAELHQQIIIAFEELGAPRVAVRSSAVAEDSSSASWAGQLDTYLNVAKDGVITAIEDCWRSIESSRAKHYADEHSVSQADRAVAVVVQAMVESEISGVMFTANPVSGNRSELMIEAVYGLGEMIVQGLATPESIVLNKTDGRVVSRSKHRQAKQLVYKAGRNVEQAVPAALRDVDILSDQQLQQLAELAEKIENYYTSPQDIEWAFADLHLFVVQSRPITTLAQQTQASDDLFLAKSTDIFRWGPIRGYYFYISDYVAACYEYLHKRYDDEYFPETLLLFNERHMVWLSDLKQFVSEGKRVFQHYIENPDSLQKMQQDWRVAVSSLTNLQITVIPSGLETLSDAAFKRLWHEFYQALMAFWVPTLLAELGNYGAPDLLKHDLQGYISDDEALIRAQEILATPEELSFYQQEELQLFEATDLKAHHAKYFWLKNSYGSVEVLPVAYFEERQSQLSGKGKLPSQRELAQSAQKAKRELQKQYNLPDRLMRRAKLIADNIVWQDHRKRVMSENFHYKKLLLEELGRRTYKSLDDLLHFGFDEAIQLLDGVTLQKRSAYHGVQFHDNLTVLDSQQTKTYWQEYAYHKSENGGTLQGIVASNGGGKMVTGKVRVLHTSHELLEPGEILVTAMTSPGYVFAMRHAAAVITDIGGLTSHAAIVSREIGVSCIVGTKVATQVLKTGDTVSLDPTTGTVTLIKGGA